MPSPLPAWPVWWTALLQLVGMFVLNDFCLYWLHRVQHASPFLWRFHAFHHRIETPSAASAGFVDAVDITLQGGLPIIISALVFRPHPITFYAFIVCRVG